MMWIILFMCANPVACEKAVHPIVAYNGSFASQSQCEAESNRALESFNNIARPMKAKCVPLIGQEEQQ